MASLSERKEKSVGVLLKQQKKKWKRCNYFIAVSISNNTEQIAVITKSSINMGSAILDNN